MKPDPRVGQLIGYLTDIATLNFDHGSPPAVSPKYDEIDSITHTAKMMSEQLRRLNRANEDFSIIFEVIPIPGLVLSHYGQILHANQHALDRLRYTKPQLENTPFPDLLGPASSIPRDRFVPLVLEGPPSQSLVAEVMDVDGTAIPFRLEKSRLPRPQGPSEYLVLALEISSLPNPSSIAHDSIPPTFPVTPMITEFVNQGANPGSVRLSKREMQVLLHLSQGLTCQKIAVELGTKKRTVESQRTSLYKRFQVNKVSALIQRANEMGYL